MLSIVMSLSICSSICATNVHASEKKTDGYSIFMQMVEENKEHKYVQEKNKESVEGDYSETMSEISDRMIEEDIIDSVYDDYEDSYAGEYLSDEGNIVVLSLDKDKTEEQLKNLDNITVVEVENNLDSLLEKKQYIDNEIIKLEDSVQKKGIENNVISNFSGMYIDVEKNAVVVELKDISDESIKTFKEKIIDDDAVVFEMNSGSEDTATGLQLGRAIYTKPSADTINRSSIGYPALYYDSKGNKVYGFITCAHGKSKGDLVYLDSSCTTKIGKVVKYHLGGNVDASFVKITNDNYTTSRKVYYKNSKGDTGGITIEGQSWYYDKDESIPNYNPSKGEKAWKAGSTSYLTSGKIVSTWATTTTATGTITDVYKTDISSSSGDSGGVFYQKDDCGEHSVMGIVKSSGSGYSYYVRIENIQKTLGLYILGYDLYHGKNVK